MTVDPVIRLIPLSKLVPSHANVRKTGRDHGIEELAASIVAHGLLQNLSVRPVLDAKGEETGKFEVVAGGRRLAALKLLVKRKAILRSYPVPCGFVAASMGEEVSLAENVFQAPLHPADQYEAFARLHSEQGVAVEDIAARFGVTPAVVKQRLRLGAVSPVLMNIYREGGMSLEQLMAFTIADDHALQERVWHELTWNKSKEMIRRLLVEGHVEASDQRARFVGAEAYMAAGGSLVRDLFDAEHEGYFDNPELLNRLVAEKLEIEADAIRVEGWKWVIVTPHFHYALTAGMRRLHPEAVTLTPEQQSQLDALEREHEALAIQYQDDDASDEIAAEFQRLEASIEALRGVERYRPDDIAICGAFVSVDADGGLRVERGFLRPDDEPTRKQGDDETAVPETDDVNRGEGGHDDGDDGEGGSSRLSDRLVTELTAHRTAGLREALARNADVALIALVHALAAQSFYGSSNVSCLAIEVKSASLGDRVPGIGDSKATLDSAKRAQTWAKRMPRDVGDLWSYLAALGRDRLLDLLAICVASAVNALKLPWERNAGRERAADQLAEVLALDMTKHWKPTVESYFASVTKAHILDAVREAVSEEAAARLAGLKKDAMAKAAEKLLKGSGWLPALLRTGQTMDGAVSQTYTMAAE